MTIATPEVVTDPLIERLMAVYDEASPQGADERDSIFRRYLQRDGLVRRFAIAHGAEDEIVGFVYGMTGRWDEWWFRHSRPISPTSSARPGQATASCSPSPITQT